MSRYIIILSIWSLMAVGCNSNDEPTFVAGQPVMVNFAYTFSSSANPSTTRQVSAAVEPTNDYGYPQLESMKIITTTDGVPSKSEFRWETPVSKTNPEARFYYTNYCQINTGVDGCLVYCKPDNLRSGQNVTYGAIHENFPASIATAANIQAINFSLVPMYNSEDYTVENNTGKDGIPAAASTLAGYLTEVANTDGWSGSGNTAIQELRQKFLNKGSNLPGSAASVKAWLEALAAAALSMSGSYSEDSEEATLLTAIQTNASTKAAAIEGAAIEDYPRDIHLPDGAAALRWVKEENAFKPQMETTTVDDINTVSRFAYPASLYYFVNSGISTSMEAVDYREVYESANTTTDPDKTAWAYVLDNFKDGPTVEGTTHSVALTDPVQYAVGQLQVNINKTSSETLKDNDNNDVALRTGDTYHFPLTGIIVGGQRPVDYEFKQTENTDTKVKFLYDSQVESGCYLTKKSNSGTDPEPQLGCKTLVLQSYDGEDVDIVLEFLNNSDQTFTGVNGCYVYPHTRFYLVGKIFAKTAEIVDDKDKRVFTKDYITTVNLTVTTLEKAYNLLPSLLTGHLELGIEVSDWVAATPEVVILK